MRHLIVVPCGAGLKRKQQNTNKGHRRKDWFAEKFRIIMIGTDYDSFYNFAWWLVSIMIVSMIAIMICIDYDWNWLWLVLIMLASLIGMVDYTWLVKLITLGVVYEGYW